MCIRDRCGTAPESLAHLLSACPALAQTKYLARHDAVLKVLFFDFMEDLGLIEASPPWYSPTVNKRITNFGAVFTTERCCAASILKVNRHVLDRFSYHSLASCEEVPDCSGSQ